MAGHRHAVQQCHPRIVVSGRGAIRRHDGRRLVAVGRRDRGELPDRMEEPHRARPHPTDLSMGDGIE